MDTGIPYLEIDNTTESKPRNSRFLVWIRSKPPRTEGPRRENESRALDTSFFGAASDHCALFVGPCANYVRGHAHFSANKMSSSRTYEMSTGEV